MKSIQVFLLTAILLLNLAGCGSADPNLQEENFFFSYNGIRILPGAEAQPILAALGEPLSFTEEPSCAFDGMDKTYYFGSFYLSTCPLNGGDAIYRIWLADDSVAAEGGIRIGQTQAEVERIYGANYFGGTNSCTQVKGDSQLTVLLTDGIVSSIQYEWLPD